MDEVPAQDRHPYEISIQYRHPDGAEVVCGGAGIGLHVDHSDEGGGVVSYQQVPGQGSHAPQGDYLEKVVLLIYL